MNIFCTKHARSPTAIHKHIYSPAIVLLRYTNAQGISTFNHNKRSGSQGYITVLASRILQHPQSGSRLVTIKFNYLTYAI
jgi:hypothetical protein